jgi:thiazole synthase ThiGH ThiG subunit
VCVGPIIRGLIGKCALHGKYQDLTETKLATEAAEAEIITVAIRRTNIGQDKSEPNLLEVINPDKYTQPVRVH